MDEAGALFSLFDVNGDGTISYDEFLRGVVG
jgi:Ca2+-binding EF-hand superfamily protein